MQSLSRKTGFTPTEIFRKYLWYLLQERSFDTEAVDDMVHLRAVLGLKDEQVADAIAERSRRILAKMGPILFATAGMTAEGIARKAAERSFFAKLLFLSECDALIDQSSLAKERLSVPDCFNVTNPADVERMRIVSLHNLDLSKLELLATAGPEDDAGNPDEAAAPAEESVEMDE